MCTFLAFGKDFVGWNYEKTGNPVYLHIKQTKKLVPEDRPSKKPTLLAIGMLNLKSLHSWLYLWSCISWENIMMCFVTFLCSFSIFVQLLSTTSVFVTYISCLLQAVINVLNGIPLHINWVKQKGFVEWKEILYFGCNKTLLWPQQRFENAILSKLEILSPKKLLQTCLLFLPLWNWHLCSSQLCPSSKFMSIDPPFTHQATTVCIFPISVHQLFMWLLC